MKIMTTLILLFLAFGVKAQNRYNTPVRSNPTQNYDTRGNDLLLEKIEKSLNVRQAEYNQAIEDCRNQAIDLYNAKNTAPSITDGKHQVTLIGRGFCQEANVIVDKGRIFSIPLTDGTYITDFTISTPIKNCYSKIGYPDKQTNIIQYFEVLFLKDMYR